MINRRRKGCSEVVFLGRSGHHQFVSACTSHDLVSTNNQSGCGFISMEGLNLTLSILPCPQGKIAWSTPCRKMDNEKMILLQYSNKTWEVLENPSHLPPRFSSTQEISLGSHEIFCASGMNFNTSFASFVWWCTDTISFSLPPEVFKLKKI